MTYDDTPLKAAKHALQGRPMLDGPHTHIDEMHVKKIIRAYLSHPQWVEELANRLKGTRLNSFAVPSIMRDYSDPVDCEKAPKAHQEILEDAAKAVLDKLMEDLLP